MYQKFLSYLQENINIQINSRILLTVSGGVDSMVMLDLFIKSGFNIGIAHCNFQLRGDDAMQDESFVTSFVEKHQLPFYNIRFQTKAYAAEKGISIQMAARELRYNWFDKIAEQNDYKYIATAHHQDDVMETFFVNILRKTGIRGLQGIKAKSGNIIRPMLFTPKNDILSYAKENRIPYREDISNHSDYYTRNYIRHHIIPVFRKLQDNFDEALSDTISILNQQESIYTAHVNEVKANIMTQQNELYTIDIHKLIQYPQAKTYLFEILYPFGFNASQIDNMMVTLEHESGKLFYAKDYTVLKDRDVLLIKPNTKQTKDRIIIKDAYQNNTMKQANLLFEIIPYTKDFKFDTNNQTAYFDADKIAYPLIIRPWKSGDTFVPFGMHGKKKLSDYFNDIKLSIFKKNETGILCHSNGDILWLIGLRSDNRYRITSQTKNILKVSLNQVEDNN